jgi:hypothetical protein
MRVRAKSCAHLTVRRRRSARRRAARARRAPCLQTASPSSSVRGSPTASAGNWPFLPRAGAWLMFQIVGVVCVDGCEGTKKDKTAGIKLIILINSFRSRPSSTLARKRKSTVNFSASVARLIYERTFRRKALPLEPRTFNIRPPT